MNKNRTTETALKISTITLGIISFLLLFPSFNLLPVMSKGEFTYIESIGYILGYLTLFSLALFFLSKKFSNINTKKRIVKYIIFTLTIGLSVCLLLSVISMVWIRFEVKTNCLDAKRAYGGNCVEALTSLLQDENQDFWSRNSAVWTLGQLADPKTLPVLQSLYIGVIPEREPLAGTISQYELKKSIKWCQEGNWTSWMYKSFAN